MVDVREDIPELFASTLERLARSGTILVDQRPDPSLPRDAAPKKSWEINNIDIDIDIPESESEVEKENNPLPSQSHQSPSPSQTPKPSLNSDLKKRNVETITSTATIIPPKSSATASSTTLASSSTTSSGLVSAATGTTTNLPTPFDSGFTSNITSTCSSFMTGFLANETFKSCLPFSLLLQVCFEIVFCFFYLSYLISLHCIDSHH